MIVKDFDAETTGFNTYNQKQKTPYVALIKGEGTRYKLERSFVRKNVNDEGHLSLPDRRGVYEVRDYPQGQSRTRYYQVLDGAARLLDTINDDDVLEAVASSASANWADHAVGEPPENGAAAATASTLDVLNAIDEAERVLTKAFEEGLDEEDVRMELDKIRRMVEAL